MATTQSPTRAVSLSPQPTYGKGWSTSIIKKRKIGLGVAPDDPGRMPLSVLKSHRHLFGILDDVVLGDDVTAGIDNEARTCRSDRHFRQAEKSAQQLVKRRGRQTAGGALMLRAPEACGVFFASTRLARSLESGDMDHCRHHGLHDRGKARNPDMILRRGQWITSIGLRG
jgi:hypothetical protein